MDTQNLSRWTSSHTIPSDKSVGSQLVHALLEAMLAREWPASELFHVQLAFEEAIINAIVHGNRLSDDKTVDVEMSCDCRCVEIRITDQGPGFDPAEVPDPREGELLEAPGGRGLLLITELMSEVIYNEQGNRVTLTKIRNPEAPGSED